jgi:ERCC4-type nuclease
MPVRIKMKTKKIFDIFSRKKPAEAAESRHEGKKKIIVDYREKNSPVPCELIGRGFDVEFIELKVGDYVAGDVVIERKTVPDFISSMLSRRLMNQAEELKQYENRLIIIEGMEERELYSDDNGTGVNANAIRGMLLSISLKHRIPVIFSKNPEDTASYISVLMNKKEKEISLNAAKKAFSKKEQLQFIIESFPGIGPKTAKKLLEKFRTIRGIVNAKESELKKAIGKKADAMARLVNEDY